MTKAEKLQVAAIKYVSERLASQCDDVEMMSTGGSISETGQSNVEDLSKKFSVQGTCSSKSTGKKKVTLENFEFLKVLGTCKKPPRAIFSKTSFRI